MGMAGAESANYLHPPRDRSLRHLLQWVGAWRVVPERHQSTEELADRLERLRKRGFLKRVDTAFGRGWALTTKGARSLGDLERAASHTKLSTLNQRLALYLAAHALNVEVVAFSRHHVIVSKEGQELRMGWRSGDLAVGLPGDDGVVVAIDVPKEMEVSPYDLDDREWLAVAELAISQAQRPSTYWTRTLVDGLVAVKKGYGRKLLAEQPRLYRAAYWFGNRPGIWASIAARVPRLEQKGGDL